ncbi:MAG TPA: hemolysin family protein [Anaerolineae bacterium]|nr:hemolysin family protein [Anaerolineae bacterium]
MLVTLLTILLIVGLLISLNALYVAGEFSSVSARKTRIIQLAEKGNRMANILLPVLQDSHKLDNYIAASQVGITISSIVLGIYGERQIAPLIAPWISRLPLGFDPSAAGSAAAAGIASTLVLLFLTTLQVVLGELVPKSVGIQYPERLALLTALPMKWSADYLLRPLIVLLNGSGALLLKLLGASATAEHTHVHSPEEIIILVKESHRAGLIDADERQFLQNIFRTSRIHAGEIAIPRTRLVAAPVDEPVAQILQRAAESAYTRIPIFEGDIDHIIGFVHLRDLFTLYRTNPHARVQSILRSAPFVPETLPVAEVWDRLNEAQSYLAFVFDEYGGTSGLITREDLVEELFGELQDEFDQERALITPAGEGRIIVRGDMLITNLNDLLEIQLPHETTHTVGGLVMEALGRVPRVGDAVEIENIRLRVEAVAYRSVTAVCVSSSTETPCQPSKDLS